jgi:hypothetical protein
MHGIQKMLPIVTNDLSTINQFCFMKVSEFYNDRALIETFGKSKVFETCRRMREVWPGFPQYSDTVTEFIAAWLIYLMAKSGRTTTKQAITQAILSGKRLKTGNELFVVWLGNLVSDPEKIKNIHTIWIFQDGDFVQVNGTDTITIFQGPEKVKSVASATQISAQFLYDFAVKLNVKDESHEDETVFESEDESEDF